MDGKNLGLLLALMAGCTLQASVPNSVTVDADESDYVKRLIRSADVDGHDFAMLYGLDFISGTERRLTKRDIKFHAAHPSTDSRGFTLQLNSGDRVRMSLKKRSVVTSGIEVVENFSDRRETTYLQDRGCFFSGSVDEAMGGHATFALCDGKVMGAFQTSSRYYEVHALPESSNRLSRSADVRVLVTWTNAEPVLSTIGDDGVKVLDGDIIEPPAVYKRSVVNRRAAIEVATYLNNAFLRKVNETLRMNTTQQLTDLIIMKWCGVAAVYSNELQVGYDVTIELKLIEIWRHDPDWFDSNGTTIGKHMDSVCLGTKHLKYDHINLESAGTQEDSLGIAWKNTICNPRWRCSVTKGTNLGHFSEAHELGHSLGLDHDRFMPNCVGPNTGFMSTNMAVFRDCYKEVLNKTLPGKGCLFRNDVPPSGSTGSVTLVPEFVGQQMEFDDQCKMKYGDEFEYVPFPEHTVCDKFGCLSQDAKSSTYRRLMENKAELGTPCGNEKLCHSGNCINWNATSVDVTFLRRHVVAGGWGPWTKMSSCRSTCDIAVRVSSRKCDNPKPILLPYCQGNMYMAELCTSQSPCPGESQNESTLVDQHARNLCSRHPSKYNFTGHGVRSGNKGVVNKCTIRCQRADGNYSNRYVIPDGTPCSGTDTDTVDSARRGISWNCVRGQCMAFGCDGRTLGDAGGKELDTCGVCGGNDTSCKN